MRDHERCRDSGGKGALSPLVSAAYWINHELGARRPAGVKQESERGKDALTVVHSGDCRDSRSGGRPTGCRHRATPRPWRGTGDGGKPTGAVLAEQAERAGSCGERVESDRAGGGRQRRGRHGGLQCRDRQHLSLHTGGRCFRRLLLLRQRPQLGRSRRTRGGARGTASVCPETPILLASRVLAPSARCRGTSRTAWSLTGIPASHSGQGWELTASPGRTVPVCTTRT